jgi:hypothetical protein
MEIEIHEHTLSRALERGTNRREIVDVLESGIECNADVDRYCKYKLFSFRKVRNDRYYEQKRVEVIYILEKDCLITVTVYVFYGKWESNI